MPELHMFVACEKVIVDDSGVVSLICLFNGLSVAALSGGGEFPSNAVAPKEWAVFSSWDWDPADEGKDYVQVIQILYPDGKSFIDRQETKFRMNPGTKHQIKAPILGFPVGQTGMYMVRMWLEDAGRVIVTPRPIRIEVKRTPPSQTP
jgi:hypothetical protein